MFKRADHERLDQHRRQRSPVQEHVIDEFVRGGLSRRLFIRNASIVGIGMPVIGAVLAACGDNSPGASSSGGGKDGATIRAGLKVPDAAINPLIAGDPGSIATMGLCGEWLTLVDEHFNVKPWLAESWTPNADGSAWTFQIRQGVKFNDGTPLTVDDVVYTFKQQADPKVGLNAASVLGGYLTPDGVEKVDDTHVRFNLARPVGNWPSYATSQCNYNAFIVPNHFDFKTYEASFPGTGRFKMATYKSLTGGEFVRNPYYWGPPAKPAKIEVSYYTDEGALTSALQAGAVDLADAFTVSGSPQLLTGGFTVVSNKSSAHRQVSMRCDTGPFANKLVRQALALTLDRPQLVQALFQGYGQVGNDSPFAPVFPSTDANVPQRVQDLAKAKELMAQAGVPNGFSCQLATWQGGEMPQYAQILKQSANAIGIDIDLSITSGSVFYGSATFGQCPWLDTTMTIADYSARGVPNVYLGAPLQTTDPQTGTGAWNSAHFSNARYDALVNDFAAALDLPAQQKVATQIQTLLLEETPIIFGYFFDSLSATQKNVSGLYSPPLGLFFWDMTMS